MIFSKVMRKNNKSVKVETGSSLPITPAGKMQLVYELMNIEVVDKNGNPILKKDGKPKTKSLLTKKQARKILGFE